MEELARVGGSVRGIAAENVAEARLLSHHQYFP